LQHEAERDAAVEEAVAQLDPGELLARLVFTLFQYVALTASAAERRRQEQERAEEQQRRAAAAQQRGFKRMLALVRGD
jgi:hypothetical protein